MAHIIYVNGRYERYAEALVHAEDRGFQLADGVYEMCAIRKGDAINLEAHLERLERSLGEMQMAQPMSRAALSSVVRETIRQNRVDDGTLYVQLTRGVAPRNHAFPPRDTRASCVVIARHLAPAAINALAEAGVRVSTQPDMRWGRCDIKAIGLAANCLAREAARENDAYEAWLMDDDNLIREGAASNAWIVDASGCLRTHPADTTILNGITRRSVLERVRTIKEIPCEERAFTRDEALRAREAFMTSSVLGVIPITHIDGHAIGNGAPGMLARALRRATSEEGRG